MLKGTKLLNEQLSVLTSDQKSGYICGLGSGLTPTTSGTRKFTRAELERVACDATTRAESAEKLVARLAERVKTLEAEQADSFAKLRAEMSSQFALMYQQLPQNYMGQHQMEGGSRS